jgi:ABC-type Na+ efflux pump permease subunit
VTVARFEIKRGGVVPQHSHENEQVSYIISGALKFVFEGEPRIFQSIGAPMCGLFPFIIMFLLTSIAMLRERTAGTLERLMTLPMAKLDLLAGYAIAFGLLAALQATVVCLVGFLALGLDAAHGAWLVANDFVPFTYAVAVHGAASTFASSASGAFGYLAASLGYVAVPLVIVALAARPGRAAIRDMARPPTPERRLAALAFWAVLVVPAVLAPLARVHLVSIWSMSAWALLPVIARDQLGLGAGGFGLLSAAFGTARLELASYKEK